MRTIPSKFKRTPLAVRRSALLGVAFCGSLGLGACHAPSELPTVSAENGSLVQLELTYTRDRLPAGTPGAPERLEAEAHFVRYRATDRTFDKARVAGLLGLGGDADLPLDSCRVDDGAPPAAAGALEVALLDAGVLTVRSGRAAGDLAAGGLVTGGLATGAGESTVAVEAVLEPHHYPELLPFVSGVVYGLEAEPSHEIVPASRIEIEAGGGEDVGPFIAATSLPRAFPNLSVVRDGAGNLELRWAVLSDANRSSPMSIELRWAGAKPGVLRCRATDDGRFAVARSLTEGLDAAISAGQSAQASVSRDERSSLEAPGAGRGELIVTLRDVATLSSQP